MKLGRQLLSHGSSFNSLKHEKEHKKNFGRKCILFKITLYTDILSFGTDGIKKIIGTTHIKLTRTSF